MQRRTFIRTAMATLALPAMESLGTGIASAAANVRTNVGSAAAGKRLVCVGNSFGMYQPNFFPTAAGRDYKITPAQTATATQV